MTHSWRHIDEFGWHRLRWSVGFLTVASAFVGIGWLVLHPMPVTAPLPALPPAAVVIELTPAPAPVAPPAVTQPAITASPPEPPPRPLAAPQQPPHAQSPPPLPLSALPDTGIPLPPPRPPAPAQRPRPKRLTLHRQPVPPPAHSPPAPIKTAPPAVQAPPSKAEVAPNAAPLRQPPANAVPTWQSQLLNRLEAFKRYPPQAQEYDEQGTAYLRFSMDRLGHLLTASIVKSAGHADLDQETLALIRRAEPLPKPPPEVAGDPVTITVPVRYSLQSEE